jgi:hypothetical protein
MTLLHGLRCDLCQTTSPPAEVSHPPRSPAGWCFHSDETGIRDYCPECHPCSRRAAAPPGEPTHTGGEP